MLIKVALVVLLLTTLLTTGTDDQQTTAAPSAATEAEASTEREIPTVSAVESASGWADEFTPITFATYR